MDIYHPDPCEELKKVRYRFMKQYELYNGVASIGYTDRSLVVFIKKELGFELPDEFGGYPVRVVKA